MTKEEVIAKIKEYIGDDKKIVNNAKYDYILSYFSSVLDSFSTFNIKEESNDLIITGFSNSTFLNGLIRNILQSLKLLANDGHLSCDSTIVHNLSDDVMEVNISKKVFEANESGFLVEKTDNNINKYHFGEFDRYLTRVSTSKEVVYDDLGIMKSYFIKSFKASGFKDDYIYDAFSFYIPKNQRDLEYEVTIRRNDEKFWEVDYLKRNYYPNRYTFETTYLLDLDDFYDLSGFSRHMAIKPDSLSHEETEEHIRKGISKTLMINPEAGKRFEKLYSDYLSRVNDEVENSRTR